MTLAHWNLIKIYIMKVKEESEKVGLILNTEYTKIMASSPITLWQIDRETMREFYFLGFQEQSSNFLCSIADGDCSHEIKDACSFEEKLLPT